MEAKRLKKSDRSDIHKDIREIHHPGAAGLKRYSQMSLRQRGEAIQEDLKNGRTYAQASARHVRISPQKVRLVVDLIRGKTLEEARAILKFTPPRASEPVVKVLDSAAANAINNYDLLEDQLFVKVAFVDEGPAIKRMLPRSRGRADMIKKRTSHITIIVSEGPTGPRQRRHSGEKDGK